LICRTLRRNSSNPPHSATDSVAFVEVTACEGEVLCL